MLRRGLPVEAVILAVALSGCGGGSKGSGKGQPPIVAAQQKDAEAFAERSSDGKPGWINKGSGAVKTGDGGRIFYGVGIFKGSSNPALARSTADNRARNEIGRLISVYSASLMKDYMSSAQNADGSTEEVQEIEQAIKTASSNAMSGIEMVDHYYAADGTIFALAQLDVAKMNAALTAAAESGAFKSYTAEVNTDDIFDQHGRKDPPPPKPPKVASDDSTPAPSAPAEAKKDEAPKAKSRPVWIDGDDPRFPAQEYLCGVGFGPTRSHAENGAYAAISRIFISDVQSVAQDFMGAYESTGSPTLEVQWTEQSTRVATSKVLSGVELKEVYDDRKAGIYYGLACLNRASAAATLTEQIREQDGKVKNSLQRSFEAASNAQRFALLAQALDAATTREVLNAELRIVRYDGVGIPGEFAIADIAAAFSEAQDELKVAVTAVGPHAEEFTPIVEEALSDQGYKVSIVEDGDYSQQDIIVEVEIKFSNLGELDEAGVYYAAARMIARLKDNKTGKVFATIRKKRREGRRTPEDAQRIVVIKFAKEHQKAIRDEIDRHIKEG